MTPYNKECCLKDVLYTHTRTHTHTHTSVSNKITSSITTEIWQAFWFMPWRQLKDYQWEDIFQDPADKWARTEFQVLRGTHMKVGACRLATCRCQWKTVFWGQSSTWHLSLDSGIPVWVEDSLGQETLQPEMGMWRKQAMNGTDA